MATTSIVLNLTVSPNYGGIEKTLVIDLSTRQGKAMNALYWGLVNSGSTYPCLQVRQSAINFILDAIADAAGIA